MIFGQNRDELREMYRESWRKFQAGEILSPLESQIATVVSDHPEYIQWVTTKDPEEIPVDQSNPFLHMGLHLALRDQVSTDRPPGIAAAYRQLVTRLGDAHDTEHRLMECLAETLWEAQNRGVAPDEQEYLQRIRQLSP